MRRRSFLGSNVSAGAAVLFSQDAGAQTLPVKEIVQGWLLQVETHIDTIVLNLFTVCVPLLWGEIIFPFCRHFPMPCLAVTLILLLP